MSTEELKTIAMFLDDDGKIKQLPSKAVKRRAILEYLSDKFSYNKDYTEKEVNSIINDWHTFGDYFILRRELVDAKLLSRTQNGARYWKEKDSENDESHV